MGRRRGQGEGSIYRRSDGRWEAKVELGRVGGKRVRKSFYGKTRREVQEKLTAFLSAQRQGIVVVDERTTLGEFLQSWLEAVRTRVRPKTYRSYEQIVRVHLLPTLGSIPLTKLQPHHVQRLVASRLELGLSPRTADYCRVVLRCALNDALRWGYVPRNVASLTDPARGEPNRPAPWTVEEARRFLEVVKGHRLEALFVLALTLGLRRGELLALRWDDIDLERGLLTVRAQLQDVRGLTLVPPKTRAGQRTLPLSAIAREALVRHQARQQAEREKAGPLWRETGFVFTTELGTPIYPRNLNRTFQGVLEKAGLRPIRFHDLRHTCATLLLSQEVHPRVVQELLGHSQIGVTLGTYTHVLPQHLADAARRLDELLDDHRDDQPGVTKRDQAGSTLRSRSVRTRPA